MPMLTPLTGGPWKNIYAPWALEQTTGWRMFYGGWDGTATSNDRVYSVTTPDFLNFQNRMLVIDHGDFLHVNNENVTQLPDGSMHMICTALQRCESQNSLRHSKCHYRGGRTDRKTHRRQWLGVDHIEFD